MSAFDKVIGYESIKQELMQVCDMIKNPNIYKSLGAVIPNGIMLYGEPGLGKTLIAKCFIEECNINSYTVRKDIGGSEFVACITSAFNDAKEHSPAIVFLDDMDKFANEDEQHRNAEEYVAVQAGIDNVKGSNVIVIATVNDIDSLPDSLHRSGRFDRKIEMQQPEGEDARAIIEHYLQSKKMNDILHKEALRLSLLITAKK